MEYELFEESFDTKSIQIFFFFFLKKKNLIYKER